MLDDSRDHLAHVPNVFVAFCHGNRAPELLDISDKSVGFTTRHKKVFSSCCSSSIRFISVLLAGVGQ